MQITKLSNSIQPYDWGSAELIPEYLGIKNKHGSPMAELWMGAHPKAPSRIQGDGQSLLDLIERTPEETIGKAVAARFGARLPFLFKVLAAERGLSIQAHPNLDQAKLGFEREDAKGIPIGAPDRNYRDKNHKPEIICALSEFWALRGFRPIPDIAAELAGPRFDVVGGEVEALSEGGDALRDLFEAIMRSEGEARQALIDGALDRAREKADPGRADRYSWILELHRQFGDDIGIVAPLYLNCIRLEPNQALFLSAGVLHAYLRGIGVELMANSDNVLRGGCTSKHVDVDELLSVLTFEAGEPEVLTGRKVSEVETVYAGDAPEFQLSRLEFDGSVPRAIEASAGPEILLCVEGTVAIREGEGEEVPMNRGESVFLPAGVARLSVRGAGRLYRARVQAAE